MAIRIPQVQERGLPSTSGVRTPDAGAFGAGVGQAIAGVGKQAFDTGMQIMQEENTAKAREVDTFYTRRLNDLKNGYSQQNGKVAYESQKDFASAVTDLRREANDRLENDAQRGMLSPLIDQKETSALDFGSKHAIKALHEWNSQELVAQAAMHADVAASQFGTDDGNKAVAALMENIHDQGVENNWAPDVVENAKHEAMSGVLKTHITDLLASDPYGAEALYNKAKASGELTAADAAGLANRVQGEFDKKIALDMADKFVADTGGDYQAAYDMSKQIEDRDQRLEVQRLIKNDMAMQKSFEQAAQKDLHEQEWNKLYQIQSPTMRDLPAPGTVDPEVRRAMESYIERRARNDNTIHNDDVLMNELLNKWAADKKAFQKEDLSKYKERLTPSNLEHLQKLMKGDEKTTQLQTTRSELYKRGETQLGIASEDKQESAKFRTSLDEALQRATEEKGGKLNSIEQKEILNQEIYQQKTKLPRESTGIFGFFRDNVTLDEAFNTAEFKATDGAVWPDDVVTSIIQQMQAADQDVTIENVQRQLDNLEKQYSTQGK